MKKKKMSVWTWLFFDQLSHKIKLFFFCEWTLIRYEILALNLVLFCWKSNRKPQFLFKLSTKRDFYFYFKKGKKYVERSSSKKVTDCNKQEQTFDSRIDNKDNKNFYIRALLQYILYITIYKIISVCHCQWH